MIYSSHYDSPMGKILLAAQDGALIGLWLEGQKYFLGSLKESLVEKDDEPVFVRTKKWLEGYFAGEKPEINLLNLAPVGSSFRHEV